jgi:peptidoglycan hydrolase-like protein with peptidoglycan-binding domain
LPLSAGLFTKGRVDITASGVTVVGSISVILQHSSDGIIWTSTKTAAVAANGQVSLQFLDTVAGDQTHLPLRPLLRLVATTTDAGDEVTISYAVVQSVDGL